MEGEGGEWERDGERGCVYVRDVKNIRTGERRRSCARVPHGENARRMILLAEQASFYRVPVNGRSLLIPLPLSYSLPLSSSSPLLLERPTASYRAFFLTVFVVLLCLSKGSARRRRPDTRALSFSHGNSKKEQDFLILWERLHISQRGTQPTLPAPSLASLSPLWFPSYYL